MKGHLLVVSLNEYGGVNETLGYPYLYIEEEGDMHWITIDCATDSIEHLGETSCPIRIFSTKIKKIPESSLPMVYFAFNKGFGSNFAYNYASYDLLKRGAQEYFKRFI